MEEENGKRSGCPKCEESRKRGARYCLYCHFELRPPETGQTKADKYAIRETAKNAKDQLKKLPIAHIMVSDQLPDGTLPNLKRLVVQPGTFTVMVSPFYGNSVLKPGQYECTRLGIGGGLKAAFRAGREPRPIYFCTVSQTPVTATFVLPDHEIIFKETGNEFLVETPTGQQKSIEVFDVDSALSRLGIRTSDNYLGGAQAQLVLRCVNPVKLLEMFIQAKLQSLDETEKAALGLDKQTATSGGAKGVLTYSMAVIARLLWGGGNQTAPTDPVALSVWDVYCAVRMEFAAAIGQSVRNEPIAHLFDAVEVRDRIAEDIQGIMSQSFDMYGIKIDRVSAFRFICPKYEELLERRVNIARDSQQLEDREKEVAIGKRQREIDLADQIDISQRETDLHKHEESDKADLERHTIKEARETERDHDTLRAEQQARQLAMDATDHQHKLALERATEDQRLQLQAQQERQRLQLQAEKVDMALHWQERVVEVQRKQLELQNEQQGALMERRIRMLQEYAKLPKDSILTIALAENPQLAAAYAASVQAQGQQERVQMQEKFRSELATAYASNNQQFTRLLQEAVRQWGQYQAAKQIGQQRPQQVINVAIPNEAGGAASGPDATSQESSP